MEIADSNGKISTMISETDKTTIENVVSSTTEITPGMSAPVTTMVHGSTTIMGREMIAIFNETVSNNISDAKVKVKIFRDKILDLMDLRMDSNTTISDQSTTALVSTTTIAICHNLVTVIATVRTILMSVWSDLVFAFQRILSTVLKDQDSILASHVECILETLTVIRIHVREIIARYLSRPLQTASLIFSTVSMHSRLLFLVQCAM